MSLRERVRRLTTRQHDAIAPLEELMRRTERTAQAAGQTMDEAAASVVLDIESAANALTTRTAPLVPGCGLLIAASGLAVKAEPTSDPLAEAFLSLAVLFAVIGFGFLTRALFLYAGRRVVGLSPTVEDLAFARERLIRKDKSAHRGASLAVLGLTCLIIGILVGVHITIK
jgi:hypothetical protein